MESVLKVAKVTSANYHIALTEYCEEKEYVMDQFKIAFATPFEPKTNPDNFLEIFKSVLKSASEKLLSEPFKKHVTDADEVMVIFDVILTDLALRDHQIHIEEFRALVQAQDVIEKAKAEVATLIADMSVLMAIIG